MRGKVTFLLDLSCLFSLISVSNSLSLPPSLQLPEPLLTFDLYNHFITVGKSIQHLSERVQTLDTNETMDIIHSLQKLLQKLPPYCYSTLQHLISHLQK